VDGKRSTRRSLASDEAEQRAVDLGYQKVMTFVHGVGSLVSYPLA